MKYKNLILISIDTLRPDCISINKNNGLLGNYFLKSKPKTPNLDRFVKNGIFFDQCISTAPYTTASHASILTGQWPWRHGLMNFYKEKLKSPTILSLLKKEGFKTLFQTDWPFVLGPNLGFDQNAEYVKKDSERSLRWMEENKKNSLACFFHFSDVHYLYSHAEDPATKKIRNDLRLRNFSFLRRKEKFLFQLHKNGFYGKIMDLYVRGVNLFDQGRFKNFILRLESAGFLKNSLIVIFSDHGERWSEGQRSHNDATHYRYSLSDEVLRVPLIFFGHTLKPGLKFSRVVRTIDIVPTIFSILGIKKNRADFDGQDLSCFDGTLKDREAHAFLYRPDAAILKKLRFSFPKADQLKRAVERKKKDFFRQSMLRVGGQKSVRFYGADGHVIEEEEYRVGKNFEEKIPKLNCRAKLDQRLNEYDWHYLNRKEGPRKMIPMEIKKQLQNLGYKV
jgi:arylsulfatase A-like enzyme